MAAPRVFISSSFYDLKHLRYSLDLLFEGLGFDSVLSEKGNIAYAFDIPLDQSCYKEVENVDIFVLIIGGRYGSEASQTNKLQKTDFYDRYESITKREYEAAEKKDIPIYILIESNVYAEYQTFLKNRENINVNYAYVDSVNIFLFIDEILSKQRNNPIHTFDKFSQIETWLKEQWAGLFREMIYRKSQNNQIRTLTTEVENLREVSTTLKKYIEQLLRTITPEESKILIASEEKRLEDATIRKEIEKHYIVGQMMSLGFSLDDIINRLYKVKSFEEFSASFNDGEVQNKVRTALSSSPKIREDFNRIRKLLDLPAIL